MWLQVLLCKYVIFRSKLKHVIFSKPIVFYLPFKLKINGMHDFFIYAKYFS